MQPRKAQKAKDPELMRIFVIEEDFLSIGEKRRKRGGVAAGDQTPGWQLLVVSPPHCTHNAPAEFAKIERLDLSVRTLA